MTKEEIEKLALEFREALLEYMELQGWVYNRSELMGMMKLSESALSKEWDSPEEDKAWSHL